ncbi:Ada metal-binding domain-containing protein [Bacillus sp. S10(2024)]|uniref:Ada metal-binding domain-containing protein n=1 Tax=Bacillus sp. S10(2024) TaxID=3162886 RepID=UPI003D1C1C84
MFGGYRPSKLYGRLDCPSALRAITKVKYCMFFADEQMAISAGFRPCAVCIPEKYARWKKKK